MSVASMKPRHHTAPSRLRKRDVPAVWDLFALDDRANNASKDDDDASSVASLSRAPSIASFASEETQLSDSFPGFPYVERGGSWPRVRKQRTSEHGSCMSLFEVAEALGADESSADADLASLAKLVAEEEQELNDALSSTRDSTDTSNISIESFVDAVFCGLSSHTPGAANAAHVAVGTPAAAASWAPAPPVPAPSASAPAPAPATKPPPSRQHTANDLALLKALEQDFAENAAATRHASTGSPTFAACSGALDLAGDDVDNDDVFAMLQDLPCPGASPALRPLAHPVDASCGDAYAHNYSAHAGFEDAAAPAALDVEYDYSNPSELPPLHPCLPPAHAPSPYPSYDKYYRVEPSAYYHAPAEAISADQLAGHLEHALGVPLDGLSGAAHSASRAPTVRGPPASRRGRPSAMASAPFAPPAHPYAALPPHPHQPHAPMKAYEGPPPSPHLDAEALKAIPTAQIEPLHQAPIGTVMVPAHMATAAAIPANAPAVAVASAPAAVSQPLGSNAGRNGAERKEWSVSEDNIIRESVLAHGCRWRRIAAQLPGRSDDAVRNRWNRLKEMGISESATPNPAPATAAADVAAAAGTSSGMALPMPQGMAPAAAAGGGMGAAAGEAGAATPQRPAPKPGASHTASSGKSGGDKPERVSWSKAEDETILRGVAELGHKWNRIAERLPGRTDHAIRNRFHRLQSLLEDRQRQQQRVLAPNMPLPLPMAVPMQPSLLSTAADVHSLLTVGTPQSSGSAGGSGFETPVGQASSPSVVKAPAV